MTQTDWSAMTTELKNLRAGAPEVMKGFSAIVQSFLRCALQFRQTQVGAS
jgi:hypothetical protein